MSRCDNCDNIRRNRGWRFHYQPMAAEGGKTKGYANRTQEFILVIKYSYNTMNRCSSFDSVTSR
jgi:hypothetical protein